MGAWSGFYKLPLSERLSRIAKFAALSEEESAILATASSLSDDAADTLIENATGSYPLPLGWAVGLIVDGTERVAPMVVEESSVVAAACNGAKMAALGGGFTTKSMEPIATGQVELRGISNPEKAADAFAVKRQDWLERLDAEIPSMRARGGGMRDLALRNLRDGRMVAHLSVDTRDAMGANLVNTLCEFIGPEIARVLDAQLGLRILSNLTTDRLVTATCKIPVAAVGGVDVAQAMVAANQFAQVDPFRAATHNKGIMNGVDPVLIATGNDWRAVEAGAHAYAAMDGQYRGLTQWNLDGTHISGELTLPLAVATVGGMTNLHPVARTNLKVLGNPSGTELARIIAAVGLAQNLAALRALAAEGIQQGHMRLHESNRSAST